MMSTEYKIQHNRNNTSLRVQLLNHTSWGKPKGKVMTSVRHVGGSKNREGVGWGIIANSKVREGEWQPQQAQKKVVKGRATFFVELRGRMTSSARQRGWVLSLAGQHGVCEVISRTGKQGSKKSSIRQGRWVTARSFSWVCAQSSQHFPHSTDGILIAGQFSSCCRICLSRRTCSADFYSAHPILLHPCFRWRILP